MKSVKRDVKSRVEFLESLGFICCHEDSQVMHPNYRRILFDFSATNLEVVDVMNKVISTVHEQAFHEGKANTQKLMKEVLGL